MEKVKQAHKNGFGLCFDGLRSEQYTYVKLNHGGQYVVRDINPIATLILNEDGKVLFIDEPEWEQEYYKPLYFKHGFLVSEIRRLGITDSERKEFIEGTRAGSELNDQVLKIKIVQSPYRLPGHLSPYDLGIAVYCECVKLNLVEEE